MIIIIIFMMAITAIITVILNRESLSYWFAGIFASCMTLIIGFMFYFAKMGGFSYKEQMFIFLTNHIYHPIQFSTITIDNIVRLMNLGRTLFPFFVLAFSLNMSTRIHDYKKKSRYLFIAIIPIINVIIYDPLVYRSLLKGKITAQTAITIISRSWISIYIIAALIFLFIEYGNVSVKWIKKRIQYILISIVSLSVLFFTFAIADPSDIFRSYGFDYMSSSYRYYNPKYTQTQWIIFAIVFITVTVLGCISLYNYTKTNYIDNLQSVSLERKFSAANMGATVFIHGLKNQLLASRVMVRRSTTVLNDQTIDKNKLSQYLSELYALNEQMIERMDSLYNVFKSNIIVLKPVPISRIIEIAINSIENKHNDLEVFKEISEDIVVLLDQRHMVEAVCNILSNASEAINAAGSEKENISVKVYRERKWCIIEISDNGIGISSYNQTKIFDPFYTSKNTNNNWGLGLSYVQQIMKSHFGMIKLSSTEGKGSTFYLMLPEYRGK